MKRCEEIKGIIEPGYKEPSYKDRMVTEYIELKEKYNKLHRMIIKYEAGTLEFTLTTPIHLLEEQAKYMGNYLRILEIRSEIEGVDIGL